MPMNSHRLKTGILLLPVLLLVTLGRTQSHTLSGYVRDAETKEPLIGVSLLDTLSKTGTFTNHYGFYSLQLKQSNYFHLKVAFQGYIAQRHVFMLHADSTLDIEMVPGYELATVNIEAENPIDKRLQMSSLEISTAQIGELPTLLGEVDVLKAYQLMPGVQSGTEGSAALYVRGGSPDQNLILLDDMPLYYVTHLGGFVSLFDANAISHSQLIKGAFPARYGGRLSSVMEVRMKEGNKQKINGNVSLGVLSGRFSLNGPIKKDTTSFLISARASTLGPVSWVLSRLSYGFDSNEGYNFYDLNAKWNRIISHKDQLFASFYTGDDRLFFRETGENQEEDVRYSARGRQNWGNLMGAFKWNHLHSPRLFFNINMGYTRFRYQTLAQSQSKETGGRLLEQSRYQFSSSVEDWLLKWNIEHYAHARHHLRYGAQLVYHQFRPSMTTVQERANNMGQDSAMGTQAFEALEWSLYLEDSWRIGEHVTANMGMHTGNYVASKKAYFSLQPRLSMNVHLGAHTALKAAYSSMQQYVHLLTNSNTGLPTDLWVPATNRIPPQIARQWVVGVAHEAKGIELSIEAFYKQMQQLIAYQEGASVLVGGNDWQNKVVTGGKGKVYGLECLLQKKYGKLTGWIGYTLSFNRRQFAQLNHGRSYPYKYDRRHDFALVLNYRLNKKITLSANWVYSSGQALTLARASYSVIRPAGITDYPLLPFYSAEYYGGKNQFRMPAYHRMDVSAQFKKQKPKGERVWTLGLYNAYSRQNPFFLYYQYNVQTNSRQLYQFSLFPILPAVSYQFIF